MNFKYFFIPLFLSVFLTSSLWAQTADFTIKNFDVEMEVTDDGDLFVSERIQVAFDTLKRGIFRVIPFRYEIDGKETKIQLSDVKVADWDFTVRSENAYKVIRIGNPEFFVEGLQDYHITYHVSGTYLWHGERPELYWDLIGTEWPTSIEQISYRITFPKNIEIKPSEYKIMSGVQGAHEISAGIQKEGHTLFGESTRIFGPNEGLSIAVLLPENFIEKPSFSRNLVNGLKKQSRSAPIPLTLAFILFWLWRNYGTNEKEYIGAGTTYYPPEEISAAEAGLFIDNHVHSRDLIALIPEWGNRGYIKVRKPEPENMGLNGELYIEKINDLPHDAPEYQQVLFDAIFERGGLITLSDLQNNIYKQTKKAGSLLRKRVKNWDLYDPLAFKIFHSGWMFVLFVLLAAGGICAIVFFQQILSGILFIILSIFAFIMQFLPPKKTKDGYRLFQRLNSFRDFLKKSGDPKMSSLFQKDPHYFDKVYPFVIAFGIDKVFTKKAQEFVSYAPAWFYWHHMNHHQSNPSFSDFSEGFKSETIVSAFTSHPQSSVGGSGSGGGFRGGGSGGGFGGGGGGSW